MNTPRVHIRLGGRYAHIDDDPEDVHGEVIRWRETPGSLCLPEYADHIIRKHRLVGAAYTEPVEDTP